MVGMEGFIKVRYSRVEKNERKEWLTSIEDLRMTQRCSLHPDKMRIFYRWLAGRKVFNADGFVVRLSIIEDLVAVFDMESYCPALRSIKIDNWASDGIISNISQFENNLSAFLSHCHNLLEVTTNMQDISPSSKQVCDIVLPILSEKLRENSLIKISISGVFGRRESR
eukprot:scaffold1206_cov184-Ochromonas_danica.AAC.10